MKELYYRVQGFFLWHKSYAEATRLIDKSVPFTIEYKTIDEMDLIDVSNISQTNM